MDDVADDINEAAIKRVMEDVGLRSVDLISEASEPTDDIASPCENSSALSLKENIPQPELNGGDEVEHEDQASFKATGADSADDNNEELEDEEEDEEDDDEMPALEDSEGTIGAADPNCEMTDGLKEECTSDGDTGGEQLEYDLQGQIDKGDQNQNSKIQGTPTALRRSSRTKLPTSPGPNETPSTVGRTTRSQINPDIIAKQKSFMHKYQLAVKSSMDSYVRSATSEVEVKVEQQAIKRKWEDTGGSDVVQSPHSSPIQEKKPKKSITATPSMKVSSYVMEPQPKTITRHDTFCWSCHSDGQVIECYQCPRVFHQRCVQMQSPIPPKWTCTECLSVRNAEKHNNTDIDQLPVMLNFAMERIKSVADAQPFFKPVDTEEFPHYTEYVVCPVDISRLEEKISQGSYASTRAFLADFRWILHNCIIFNSFHSKLTSTARTLMKVCKHEMAEIDTCADCYVHAHTKRETWFLEPCRRPHLLLWAKLKGFPHWPAKAMKANKEGNVDVRFFGAHDRAWVPAKDCFLYSREMPMQLKNQRKANLIASVEEVDQHIKKLVERYGSFAYPSPRTTYNPLKEDEQLNLLIPGYKVTDNSSSSKLDRIGDSGETESDSDAEVADNDPNLKAAVPKGDRTEGRNFLAMLQLAPRSLTDTATPTTGTPTSTPPSPLPSIANVAVQESKETIATPTSNPPVKMLNKSSKAARASVTKTVNNCNETVSEAVNKSSPVPRNDSKNESSCEILKVAKARLSSPPRRYSTSKEIVPIKTEPVDVEEDDDSSSMLGSKACSISLSIDNVVGNYKPLVSLKPKNETATKPAVKSGAKLSSAKPSGAKTPTQKSTPKSISKTTSNRPTGAKTLSSSKTNAKPGQTNRRLVGEEEEDLDPAMYLDPTITITLINSEEKKAVSKTVNEIANSISSSDLQALNALGENVSITVVPKRKPGSTAASARSKENEVLEQPMVIEVDPVALQKTRAPAQTAKARKSFPKSRQVGQPGQQKASLKNVVPPMVSIPSRHLGMEIARPSTVSQQSTSSRIPSITVRPVTQLPPSQPSIILQSGSSDATPISAIAAAMKQPTTSSTTTTSSNNTNNNTLTLNTMHTLGPDSGFGTGGLLLTFNRSLPAFAATGTTSSSASSAAITTQSKSDSGLLTAQLASRTQQITDMVRNTLETLMQEMSSAGNLEATIVQLQLDLERCRSLHQQEIAEMKKTLDTQQTSAETDKQRALSELRRQLEAEKQRAIEEIKKKQWCAHCSQEAIFYCCWNTAYCDYPCQQSHWPKHMATCANANQNTEVDSVETEGCNSPTDSSVKTPSPQKSIPTVNGSPCQGKKITATAKTNHPASPNEGCTVLTSSDMSTSLSSSPTNAVTVRVGPSITGAQSIVSTAAPVTLLVSTPVPPAAELAQPLLTTSVPLPLPTVQCVEGLETSETRK